MVNMDKICGHCAERIAWLQFCTTKFKTWTLEILPQIITRLKWESY